MHLRTYAVVGAESSDLSGQVDKALPNDPDSIVHGCETKLRP